MKIFFSFQVSLSISAAPSSRIFSTFFHSVLLLYLCTSCLCGICPQSLLTYLHNYALFNISIFAVFPRGSSMSLSTFPILTLRIFSVCLGFALKALISFFNFFFQTSLTESFPTNDI